MKNYPYEWVRNVSALLEKRQYTAFNILLFSVFVGATRRFLEWVLGGVAEPFPMNFAVLLGSFYWLSFFSFAVVLKVLVPQPWRISINVVMVGMFLGILPPLIDTLIGGTGFSYAYVWGIPSKFNWYLYNPELNIPAGEAIVLWTVILFTAVYVYHKTGRVLKTVVAGLLAYAALLFLGGLAPGLALSISESLDWEPTHQVALVNLLQITSAFLLYLTLQPRLVRGLGRRFPSALPYLGLCLAGSVVAGGIAVTTLAYMAFLAILLMTLLGRLDQLDSAAATAHTYADAEDRRFLAITGGFYLAAFAAANSTAFLPFATMVATAFLFHARWRGLVAPLWAASSFMLGAIATLEEAAYEAPRWWIAFLPEEKSAAVLGPYDGLTLAALFAVLVGSAAMALLKRQPATSKPPLTVLDFAWACALVATIRLLADWVLAGAYPLVMLATTLNSVGFYCLLFMALLAVLRLTSRESWGSIAPAVGPWLLIGILPPVLNGVFGITTASNARVWLWPGWSWWLSYPTSGSSLGEMVVWWVYIATATGWVWHATRHWPRALAAFAGSYLAVSAAVLAPPLVAEFLASWFKWPLEHRLTLLNLVQTAATLGLYLSIRRPLRQGLMRRLPHTLPFLLFCLLGSAFAGGISATAVFHATITLVGGWIALAQNDYFDTAEDSAQGRRRYLNLDDVHALTLIAALIVAVMAAAHSTGTLLMLMGFTTYILYNFPSYRAKRYFPSNLKIEGVWGFSAFAFGIVAAYETAAYTAPRWWVTSSPLPDEAFLGPLPGSWLVAMLLAFGGFSLVAVLKDYKDWEADRAAGVQTLYTIAADRAWSLPNVHRAVRAICAVAVASAPWLMVLSGKLAWPFAIGGVAAGVAVWLVMSGAPSGRRFRLTLYVLATYFLYLILVLEGAVP